MYKILVVDDEVVVTIQLEKNLAFMGYAVVGAASSGEEAIEMARLLKPDLILMDIVMPGKLDGIEASEIINVELDIPVIFLTAYTDDELINRAKNATPFGYIVKPFHNREIMAVIEVAICKKKVEMELKESEERFRLAFENTNSGMCLVDLDGRLTRVNDRMCNIFGYSQQELENMTVNDLAHPEDLDIILQFIKQSISGEIEHAEFQKRCIHKRGDVVWGQVSSSLVRGPKGDPLYFIFNVQDITERKQAEDALRDSRYMLQIVLDSIPAGVFWKDRDSIYLGGNRTWLEAAGLKSLEEVVGKSDCNLPWEKKQTDSFREDDRRVMESGIPEYDIIEAYLRADDTHAWARTNKVPLRDMEGNVVGVLGTYEDITERKHVEEALRQSERDLRLRNQINNVFLTYPDEKMYAEILKLIQKAMESKYGTFGYFDENGSFVAPAVTRKIYWDKCNVPDKNIKFQKGTFGGVWGRAIKERKTLISNDGPFNTPKGHIHIENTMVTPIIFHDEVISTIHIANKPNGYDEQDRGVLETIADQIAPVLYARLQRDRKDVQRKQADEKLQERMNELETFYRTTLGREERVIEMKQEVNQLLEQLGKNKKYRDYSKE